MAKPLPPKPQPIPTISLANHPYLVAKTDSEFINYIVGKKGDPINACDYLKNNKQALYNNVVLKLQKGTTFAPSDNKDLKDFAYTKAFRCDSGINTSCVSDVEASGKLYELFNLVVSANKGYSDFVTKQKLIAVPDGHLMNLFSIIKHCQKPDSYPIRYLQWVNLNEHCKWSANGADDYERLCNLYNNIPSLTDTPRQLHFAAYMDFLAQKLMKKTAPTIHCYKKQDLYDLFNTYKEDIDAFLSFHHSLNLILYGPPGTGKTYNTINKALDIVEPNWRVVFERLNPSGGEKDRRKYAQQRFDYYKDTTGQIMFTTFHQSMSYEDFIEGIKPIPDKGDIEAIHKNDSKSKSTLFGDGTTIIKNLSRMKYEVRDGVFKKLCTPDFRTVYNTFKTVHPIGSVLKGKKQDITIMGYETVPKQGQQIECIKFNDGKTERYIQTAAMEAIFAEKAYEFKKYNAHCVPTKSNSNGINATSGRSWCYEIVFDELKRLESELKRNTKVLIIDEINRGNVAQIFGELITLIEPSKRLGNNEAMTATLPYSQEPFGVPNNLYIIGTMNTADRSVEALDTALRRRFSFEEMMPKPGLLKDDKNQDIKVCGFELSNLLKTINDRIVALKDREHQIGHSYFMWSKEPTNKEEWLAKVFKDKIIPLLQEYFYGDYKKIYYVLGGSKKDREGFVRIDSVKKSDIFAVKIDEDYDYEIPETRYEIQTIDEKNIQKAIDIMMKKVTH